MFIGKNPVLSFVIALYGTCRNLLNCSGIAGSHTKPLHTEKEDVTYESMIPVQYYTLALGGNTLMINTA